MRFHQNQHTLTIELCSKVCLEAPSLRIRIRLLLSFKFWRKPQVKKSNDKGSGDFLIGKFLKASKNLKILYFAEHKKPVKIMNFKN